MLPATAGYDQYYYDAYVGNTNTAVHFNVKGVHSALPKTQCILATDFGGTCWLLFRAEEYPT
jgi:hypothetical protein